MKGTVVVVVYLGITTVGVVWIVPSPEDTVGNRRVVNITDVVQ